LSGPSRPFNLLSPNSKRHRSQRFRALFFNEKPKSY
jgi:hypothetical protein